MHNNEENKKISDVLDELNGHPFDSLGKVWESSVKDPKDLFCFGCAHSASSQKFPGKPSGERPCFFCVRNKDREKWQKDHLKRTGHELKEWYDSSPIAFYPMDAYSTLDMKEQQERWERKAKGDPDWNVPKGGLRFG